jgi:DNA topoisomerase-1
MSVAAPSPPARRTTATSRLVAALAEAKAAARSARLHYVNDTKPGITRRRSGTGWAYRHPDGSLVRDEATLARIRALAIPPAYRDVWISTDPLGHLQATGKDARGRKQYRYHPQWRRVRDETKYDRVLVFARVLPLIRAQVALDLARHGLPREKVLATIVRLMEATLMRVGNESYARENKSFGLTTLRNRHVEVHERRIHLAFKGKSGITHALDVNNPQLARIVRKLRDLPGQELFQYLDENGARHSIDSADVNDYLRAISGEQITAKDFRTWAGTQLAALAFAELERFETKIATRSAMMKAIETVAKELGNTPAICRKCYIHPAIFDAYLDGDLVDLLKARIDAELSDPPHGLTAEEAAIMALLERRLAG